MTATAMPSWLRDMLVAKGVMTEQGLTRKARIHTCRKCQHPTLAGIDSDLAGIDAWCDLGQLHATGEAMALLAGRRTFELWGGRLGRRDHWMIAGRPAATTRYPVFADHRCHEPIPATWCVAPTPALPRPDQTEEVPF